MRLLFIILFIFFSCGPKVNPYTETFSYGNIASKNLINNAIIPTNDSDIFTCMLPIEPEIINQEEFSTYLQSNLVLDSASLDTIPLGKYTAVIEFSIDEKGKTIDASILKDPGYGLGERAKETILQYKNNCIISRMYMETHKVYRLQPITFLIEDEECKESIQPDLIL